MFSQEFWYWFEETELAFQVGATWWFPFIESIHVLSAVFVLGSILMVDLRLMGLAARAYSVRSLIKELVPWSWAAFLIALLTGGLLFIVAASNYVANTAFLIKLGLLGLAGLNMACFHFYVLPSANSWDAPSSSASVIPSSAKASAAASLLLWSGVMLAGRWIGHLV